MNDRPYVLLSCAISVDGYLDDASDERLLLSNAADLERVDEVRAGCDAILVGAGTIRRDNPRLLVRSPARQQARRDRGLGPTPIKVAISGGGPLDPRSQFFAAGEVDKLVYTATAAADALRGRLESVATVVAAGEPVDLRQVLDDLGQRGIGRLLVEGGSSILAQFLTQGLAAELQLVVAPVFVGDDRAPRFTGALPTAGSGRMTLAETRAIGDCVLNRYDLTR